MAWSKREGEGMAWDMTKWTVEEILRWFYAVEERSDRVISNAMASDDWSEHDSDERLYKQLKQELARRGLRYTGKGVEKLEDTVQ